MKLTKNIYYLLLVIVLPTIHLFGQDTYLDTFSDRVYNNSDGNTAWTTSWIETNDNNNPVNGRIRITNGSERLRFRDLDGDMSIARTIDLSGYSSVTLTLDYDADQRGNETLLLQLWNDTTNSWNDIQTINDDNSNGSITHILTSDEISSDSEIRFITESGNWGGDERIFIDNVLFTAINSTPEISINNVAVDEDAGTLVFTVSHTGATTAGSFTIEYTTVNNTATAPDDYTAESGTITFTGTILGDQTIDISIFNDTEAENAQTFFVNLSNPSDGSVNITDNQGIGTINANDPISITINDVSVSETAGTASFTVTSSGGSLPGGYNIDFATADDSATTVDNDYTSTSSPPSLSFSGNLDETQTITVPILDDSDFEGDETYFVDLSNPSSAFVSITDNQGLGTIEDNEAGIAIGNASVDEDAGTMTFTVTLTGDIPGGFTVAYATADNSATDPDDYMATTAPNPTLSFTGTDGETQNIDIPIFDDTVIEGDETFFVNLSNVSSGTVTISDAQGIGTIIDDDEPFIINDTGIIDNTCDGIFVDSGSILSNYSNFEGITYTLCPDTPGSFLVIDFTSFDVEDNFDALAIFEGTTTATLISTHDNGNIPTTIISSDPSGCLTFVFTSDGSVTGTGWQANISCTNAGNSLVTLDNVTVDEDDGTATFTATFSGANIPGGFTVDYNTEDGTAYADSDFVFTSGTLNFSGISGETLTITVPIINNIFAENTETYFLRLSNPSTTIGLASGIGTILDDGDPAIGDDVPLTLFDDFSGYYDYALTAGTLRTADEGVDPCAITTISSNTLTTPILAGSTIEKAYLTWGHSGLAADDVVTFQGQSVTADVVNTAFGFYYGMVSDVTALINSLPDPSTATYTFTDLVVDNSDIYCGSVVFGGWSLYIFYTNPTLPAVTINMYNGFDAQGGNTDIVTSSYTLDGFFAIGSTGSKTSVLSWEGDPARTGNEIISLTTGSGTTNLTGDGNNSPTLANVFNSTIYDETATPIINDSSLFGFDLDTYDISPLIAQGETTATTNIQTQGDFVILNSVLLKVPSNLMTGFVFEDINYPGGAGRDLASSSGVGIEGVTVELYDNTGTFIDSDVTDASGQYNIGGMANGTYSLRVVHNTVRSTRGGGAGCTTCVPVQTFRSTFTASTLGTVTDEVGGTNPANEDVGAGILTGAQTVSTISITNEGAVGIDFGFNFNTIVNTNEDGQGSLGQFIINSNNLDETGLDIEANSIFNPVAGEDTSIFMIPPTSDPLGRPADANFGSGFFDINLPSTPLEIIMDDTTHIDGRTQTAYSGDSNMGTIGSGGTSVGIAATALPDYNLPEIQVRSDDGDVIQLQASDLVVRNIAIYAGDKSAILQEGGTGNLITENLLGVNALGAVGTVGVGSYVSNGYEIKDGSVIIDGNYIASNTDFGILVNGGTSTLIENNHVTNNGFRDCEYNITIEDGSNITIQNNLINGSASTGILDNIGSVTITENTITTAGSDTGCTELSGINLAKSNTSVTNNIINTNAGSGIVLTGDSGNLISQNSIFANGTFADALGIDINDDGVTINDSGDGDGGPNESLNFPVIESATIGGNTLKIVGWSRPGTTIEIFLTDINQGTATTGDNQLGLTQDYGEGQVFLGSAVEGSASDTDNTVSSYNDTDGNSDTTNRFNISIALGSAIPAGSFVTSTATLSNSTSEFGNGSIVGIGTVITNRRITYRVKPN